MRILVTGGAGYIGTHTIVALAEAGHSAVVVDNLCNSHPEALRRVEQLIGKPVPFYKIDVRDGKSLAAVFSKHHIDAVIHFAGLKAVGESVSDPLAYYRNNIDGALTLCEVMQAKGVKKIIFSSTAAVYGAAAQLPIAETASTDGAANPYARSKVMVERILQDVATADPEWSVVILRYFNPVGAHPSGIMGEDPNGAPNNLMPYIAQVAVGRRPKLHIFGSDYDTPDGTGMRDYLHVMDLAQGHIAALRALNNGRPVHIYNLGTGKAHSVMEMIATFERVCGRDIAYAVVPRRRGDVACSYADPAKAARELHWRALRTLDDMCIDTWRWQSRYPHGYRQSEPLFFGRTKTRT